MRNENRGTYPAGWQRIAARVKRLHGHRCERCGHPSRPGAARLPCDAGCTHVADGKQRVLTVHHLDGDKSEWHLWNLAALCQVCHLVIQGRVAFHQTWPWPHTPWMQRHVDRYERWRQRHGDYPDEAAEAAAEVAELERRDVIAYDEPLEDPPRG